MFLSMHYKKIIWICFIEKKNGSLHVMLSQAMISTVSGLLTVNGLDVSNREVGQGVVTLTSVID